MAEWTSDEAAFLDIASEHFQFNDFMDLGDDEAEFLAECLLKDLKRRGLKFAFATEVE